MSLTLGTGPLGSKPGGDFNFGWDGAPAHRLYFEPFPRRVRALVDDRIVLDSTRGRLLFESNLPPRLYVPLGDLDASLLEPSDTTSHCPFKGDASYRSLRAGERVIEDAVWLYEEPIEAAPWLEGFASLYWDKADAWFVEEERVIYGLRDPYHRVDVAETSRPVRVTAGGELIAESERAKLLFETGLAPRCTCRAPTSPRAHSPPPPSARRARTRARRPTGTCAGRRGRVELRVPAARVARRPRARQLRRRGHRGRARRAGRPLRARRAPDRATEKMRSA